MDKQPNVVVIPEDAFKSRTPREIKAALGRRNVETTEVSCNQTQFKRGDKYVIVPRQVEDKPYDLDLWKSIVTACYHMGFWRVVAVFAMLCGAVAYLAGWIRL